MLPNIPTRQNYDLNKTGPLEPPLFKHRISWYRPIPTFNLDIIPHYVSKLTCEKQMLRIFQNSFMTKNTMMFSQFLLRIMSFVFILSSRSNHAKNLCFDIHLLFQIQPTGTWFDKALNDELKTP
jgi:hypothetical protein